MHHAVGRSCPSSTIGISYWAASYVWVLTSLVGAGTWDVCSHNITHHPRCEGKLWAPLGGIVIVADVSRVCRQSRQYRVPRMGKVKN